MTQNEKNTHLLVVLSDGETYSGISGAMIVEVTDEVLDAMQNDTRYRWIAAGSRDPACANLKKGIVREIDLEAKLRLGKIS
jgi:hypothetical protein